MLGFPILYSKSMKLMMFQLSGFYCKYLRCETLNLNHNEHAYIRVGDAPEPRIIQKTCGLATTECRSLNN